MTYQDFKDKIEASGESVGLKEKIFWEISRCSDRHSDYMLMVMEQFDKLSNLDKIEVVQMLWGSLTTNREQLVEYIRKSGGKAGDPSKMKPEYFFGTGSKWK